ncbi:Carboxylic ester hydrolase [Mycena venus]|uniref:Carboxylic ester hydrolase n=1 Tax=Mycena venus TaxID=2733690 RepID=A0A8H6YHI3_9AGAR|nr:Carboxylic ester hydrolase [Mycena venus]
MLLLLALISVLRFLEINGSPTVRLGKTTVVGRDIPTFRQDFFGGIPFAEPPLGDLRLAPPVFKPSLDSSTFNATNFGPGCLSVLNMGPQSEDCLSINVLRPSGTSTNHKLPVMFWTYGGAFFAGVSSTFNASQIVAQSVQRGTPIIYVSFNYRLGPLGFPQGHEARTRGALNLALKDQLTALQWVQQNIHVFGGDKNKVTIFGESAGAVMSSLLFLNSPIDKLARAAIFESGSQTSLALFVPEVRETAWQNFAHGVASCASAPPNNTFDCLRKANSTEIFQGLLVPMPESNETVFAGVWNTVIDGPEGIIPDLPSVLFKRGHFVKLPFIAGTNLDEGVIAFLPQAGTLFVMQTINSTQQIASGFTDFVNPTPGTISLALQAAIQKLLALYPDDPSLGSPFNTGNNTFGLSSQFKRAAAIEGDLLWTSSRRLWIEAAASADVPTFGYLFTQPQPTSPPEEGVVHGSEIAFVYGTPPDGSASSLLLSRAMIDYWVSFTTSLTPNDGRGSKRPQWSQFTLRNKTTSAQNKMLFSISQFGVISIEWRYQYAL